MIEPSRTRNHELSCEEDCDAPNSLPCPDRRHHRPARSSDRSPAAVAESPCAHSKSKQFDFWIGDWDVTAGGKPAGKSKIEPLLGGCVLQEHWSGAQGGAGTSLNYFNPETGKWHQHWVWQKGTAIDLEGELRDGRMVLEGETIGADGKKSRSRITWTANPDRTVRQLWESSSDSGKTWTAIFDGLYRRRPAPSAGT